MSEQRPQENQLRKVLLEAGKVVSKFVLWLLRVTVKGLVRLYRYIGQRRTPEARRADQVERDTERKLDAAEQMRGKPSTEDKPTGKTQFVEATDESDTEAMALLEDFLRETAADGAAAQPEEPAAAPQQAPVDLDQPVDAVESATDAPDAVPETDAEHKARIQAEEQQRKAAAEADEARQAEIRAAMEADMQRIREEKRQREEAFQQAERERKRREAERRAALLGEEQETAARLTDEEPESDESTAPDAGGQQHNRADD